MSTRQALEAQLRVSVRTANLEDRLDGRVVTTAAIFLHAASGNPERALAMLPEQNGKFWALVANYLGRVAFEEQSERGPVLKTTGTEG